MKKNVNKRVNRMLNSSISKTMILSIIVLSLAGCNNKPNEEVTPPASQTETKSAVLLSSTLSTTPTMKVVEITTEAEFQEIIKLKERLVVFDLYADWCAPCKKLSPILDEIATTHGERASFYKINTEKLPSIARAFKVKSIPYVVFLRDGAIVNSHVGLLPKEAYEKSVEILSEELAQIAQGTLVDGNRRISISSDKTAGNILAYRGDKVELTVKATGKPFKVTAPDLKIEEESRGTDDIVVTFKVKELGYYPLFISSSDSANNNEARNSRLWLGVIQYGANESEYKEVDAKEFAELAKDENSVILDVRTKGEYNRGHIKGATLIPVQELQRRVNELDSLKDKTILVYCRSGNRSTVAASILKKSGFKSIVNLRPGINSWLSAGFPVIK
jgi:thioredoxin